MLTVLLACRDEAPDETAEHDHDVDADEPIDCDAAIVPLLELTHATIQVVRRSGELTIVELEEHPDQDPTTRTQRRIQAIDGCGMAARTLADGLVEVDVSPRADLPWLVTGADARRWLFDPVGERPPHRVASNLRSVVAWSARGPVVQSDPDADGRRALVELAMDSTGDVRVRTLHPDVTETTLAPTVVSTRLAAETGTGSVVVIDLDRATVDTVASADQSAQVVDREGECFVIASDPARDRGLWVSNRRAAVDIALGRADWTDIEWRALTGVVEAVQGPTSDAPAETQLVLIPEMRELWWPAAGQYDLAARAPDGSRVFVQDEVVLWLAADGDDPRRLDLGLDGQPIDRIELFVFDDALFIAVRAPPDERGITLSRWFRPLPSGDGVTEVFDHPVLGAFRVDDEHWTYFDNGIDSGWRGDLWLYEASTAARWPLGTAVQNEIALLNPHIGPALRYAPREDVVFIESTEDMARSTLWLARFDGLE